MELADLTMPDFTRGLARTVSLILPCGSVEEHGPHLPLGTDTFHALEVARRVAARVPVFVAPPLYYGLCRSTRDHPGTISLSGSLLRALVVELGREFHRQGLRRLLILTGHAGGTHTAALIDAGEQLLVDLPDLNVAVVNILDVLAAVLRDHPGLVATPGDAHAGEVETSLIQALHPHLVKGTAPAEWPSFPRFILARRKRKFWPGGVWGDPGPASPQAGERLLDLEADFIARLVSELDAFQD